MNQKRFETFNLEELNFLLNIDKDIYFDLFKFNTLARVLKRNFNVFIARIKNNIEIINRNATTIFPVSLDLFQSDKNNIMVAMAEIVKLKLKVSDRLKFVIDFPFNVDIAQYGDTLISINYELTVAVDTFHQIFDYCNDILVTLYNHFNQNVLSLEESNLLTNNLILRLNNLSSRLINN